VRIAALALTDESRRFVKGFPARGARRLLTANLDICRLAALVAGTDRLDYIDERVSPLNPEAADLVLAHVTFGAEQSARELAARLGPTGPPVAFFGPSATAWNDQAPAWVHHRVHGDILNVWPQVRADAAAGALEPVYRAGREPVHAVGLPGLSSSPEMNAGHQSVSFCRGCACPPDLAPFCTEFLYYGDRVHRRPPEEVVGEVISLPGKQVSLLDEDVARFPDYYADVFARLWKYRRHWTVNAGTRIFDHPDLVRLLAKAGTKVVILNETFLSGRLAEAAGDPRLLRWLRHSVKSLQARRLLVGARVTTEVDPARPADYDAAARALRRTDLDFLLMRLLVRDAGGNRRLVPPAYRHTLSSSDPSWLRRQFYSLEAIAGRLARRPRRVGFYSTLVYLLPLSMAYRHQFFEGIPDY